MKIIRFFLVLLPIGLLVGCYVPKARMVELYPQVFFDAKMAENALGKGSLL